jgi:hypothetical protein
LLSTLARHDPFQRPVAVRERVTVKVMAVVGAGLVIGLVAKRPVAAAPPQHCCCP